MDHGRFKYSAISKRPRLKLPDGARVAVWVIPNIEHFHYGKPAMSMTPMTISCACAAGSEKSAKASAPKPPAA